MYSSPVQIPGTTWSKVGARANTVFGIKTDGTAWAWGQNNYGMLGANFDDSDRSSPIQIPGTDWNRFNVGSDHVCGTKIV